MLSVNKVFSPRQSAESKSLTKFPFTVILTLPFIIRIIKDDGSVIALNHSLTNVVRNPIKIEIFITINFRFKKPLSIPYRIKYTSSNDGITTCHLSSDICKLELVKTNDHSCDIE